ncbi:MAG: type II secretory pathway protein [Aestuariibacter sp.]
MKYTCAMCRNRQFGPASQQGSMLVISVFVIVVMSFLAVTLTRLISTSQDAIAYEVIGLRALNAARSGLEQGVLSVFCTQAVNIDNCSGGTTTQDFSDIQGLLGCSATYACTNTEVDGVNYFRFESQGQCISSDFIVSRTVSIDGKNINTDTTTVCP